jgi:hypothetical protein
MTLEVAFVSLILPAIVIVGALIAVKVSDRDLKRTYGR